MAKRYTLGGKTVRPVKPRRKKFWYGPALNVPGHKLHRAKPVVFDGKHIGWLMPTLGGHMERYIGDYLV